MKKLEEDVRNNPYVHQYKRSNTLKANQVAVHFRLRRLGVTYKKMLGHLKADKEERTMFLKRIEQ